MIGTVSKYPIHAVLTLLDTQRIKFDMQTFTDIIEAFGGPVPFRDALSISDVHARQMKLRDSIPAGYWPRTVEAARERGIDGVTLEVLAELAKKKLDDAARAKAIERRAEDVKDNISLLQADCRRIRVGGAS